MYTPTDQGIAYIS